MKMVEPSSAPVSNTCPKSIQPSSRAVASVAQHLPAPEPNDEEEGKDI